MASTITRRLRNPDGTTTYLDGATSHVDASSREALMRAEDAGQVIELSPAGKAAALGTDPLNPYVVRPYEACALTLQTSAHTAHEPFGAFTTAGAPQTFSVPQNVDALGFRGDYSRARSSFADITRADDGGEASTYPTTIAGRDVMTVLEGNPGSTGNPPIRATSTVPNARAEAVGPAWTGPSITTVADATFPEVTDGPLGVNRRVHRIGNGSTTLAGQRLTSPWAPSSYWHFTQGGRRHTVVAWLRTSTGTAQVKLRRRWQGIAADADFGSPEFTVTTTPQRFVWTVALFLGGSQDYEWDEQSMAVEVVSVSTSTLRLHAYLPQLYAGEDRGGAQGLDVACFPWGGPMYYPRWPNPQLFSRIDFRMYRKLGSVTSLSLSTQAALADGSIEPTQRPKGHVAGPSVSSISFEPHLVRWAFLRFEEVRAAVGGADSDLGVAVALIDAVAAYVVETSDRVESLEVIRSTEADADDGASPFGGFTASICRVSLENTGGDLSPSRNQAVDVGGLVELAAGVIYESGELVGGLPVEVLETIPLGVFYSDSWDAPEDSRVAIVTGQDALGRYGSVEAAGRIRQDYNLTNAIRDMGIGYLNLPDDDIVTDVSSYTVPWLIVEGTVSTFLADCALVMTAALYIDRLGRLVVRDTQSIPAQETVTLTDDLGLLDVGYPFAAGRLRNVARMTGHPVTASVVEAPLYKIGQLEAEGTVAVPHGTGLRERDSVTVFLEKPGTLLRLRFRRVGAINTFQSYTPGQALVGVEHPSVVRINIPYDIGMHPNYPEVAYLEIAGFPLEEGEIAAEAEAATSRLRYGDAELETEIRLAQTLAQLQVVAGRALETFRGIDDAGNRELPELDVQALGLPSLELQDRVLIASERAGVSGEYSVVEHRYEADAGITSNLRLRKAPPAVVVARADIDRTDDAKFAGV